MSSCVKERALIVGCDPQSELPTKSACLENGFWPDLVNGIGAVKQAVAQHDYRAFLLFPSSDCKAVATLLLCTQPAKALGLVLRQPTTETIVEAVKDGADFVVCAETFLASLRRCLGQLRMEATTETERCTLSTGQTILAASPQMQNVLSTVERLRNTDSTVLILGESGTGKELISRLLHETSERQAGPFVAVNCAAIPETLLESTLFGHVKGAFTDATADRIGMFEQSHNGTLFLDEIGELPGKLQVKLLRAIEQREITPVGGSSPRHVDIRIIAATNQNLESKMKAGKFREDLYYRLCVIPIVLPPLRERPEDIETLFQEFLDDNSQALHRELDGASKVLRKRIRSYAWPGNARELRNAVERASVLSRDGKIHASDLFHKTESERPEFPYFCPLNPRTGPLAPYAEIKACCDMSYLQNLVEYCEGNISKASQVSGKQRAELYRQFRKYHIILDGR
ncbi:MAG: sigma-54-dependent Fis family transcriptional regulator [Bdellovibrionales bacterium]|nr:sigma-54-dependent Fis family transcriptional regulator [Bdellovibrionales bacterium]